MGLTETVQFVMKLFKILLFLMLLYIVLLYSKMKVLDDRRVREKHSPWSIEHQCNTT